MRRNWARDRVLSKLSKRNEPGAEMITFDLSTNYAEALLRHARTFQPQSGDPREDMRLRDALDDLAEAVQRHLYPVTDGEP